MNAPAAIKSFDAAWLARKQSVGPLVSPMSALRQEAMARFARLGLPGSRDESWRYTNLRAMAARSFQPPSAPLAQPTAAIEALNRFGAAASAITLVLVNGQLQPGSLQRLNGTSARARSLAEFEREQPAQLAGSMLPLSDAEHQRWVLLNTALFGDGLHIHIDGGLETPLLVLHVSAAAQEHEAVHTRVMIDAAPGAKARIIEHHVAATSIGSLQNTVTAVSLGAGSSIEHFRIFSGHARAAHLDFLSVHQGRDSHFRQHTAVLGGGFVRANLDADLAGAGASLANFALLTGQEARHVDCMNRVVHSMGPSQSRQTARIVAGGRSRVIFNSQVVVQPGADKSDSGQSCRGLLLSPEAEIDTRPQLEIHADDVKCAHGATTGRLDPDMLFYMLSRGLDRATAQSLLVFAFLADALTGMSSGEIRSAIETDLIAQLPEAELLQQFR